MKDKAKFMIQELSGLVSLKIRSKKMSIEDHKREIDRLKNGVLASALARVYNCGDKLYRLTDEAFLRATRSNNSYIQGRLSEASLKLKEFKEIMDDPQIRALVDPENELPDCMKDALKRHQERQQGKD